MRKNLKVLAWVGVGIMVLSFLCSYALNFLTPAFVGANDFYWVFMGLVSFIGTVGTTTGSVFLAGALLIHFGLDRRELTGADPEPGAAGE
ncbi:hypothetical protein ACFWHR_00170 [Leucobacter sp. NPDC058333]|uniref:hypothetical protein n=1 Tax=Leucobacter sp. NPDC058333 TaxID=3346450 RepID=UPI0036614B65